MGTTVDTNGVLTVAAGETATTLTVRATSTVDTSKSGTATVTVTPSPAPARYQIIEGQAGEWMQGGGSGLRFTANADYSKFTSVSVDNFVIAGDRYTVENGSTVVTLKAAYLSTLALGGHTLRIDFTDGYAETTFTVRTAAAPVDPDVPKTGDPARPMLWLGIALMAGAALAASRAVRRRRQNG